MPAVKTRRAYRPLVENLETYCLLSALPVNPPATVHQASIVNLMGTQVDRDAYNIISQASPHFAGAISRSRCSMSTATRGWSAG